MRVLFFAQAKDAAGTSEMELKISGCLGFDEIWSAIIAMRPSLAALKSSTRLSRNGEYANEKTFFEDADEVGLIPPVSGG